VQSPALLIVGGYDDAVIRLNKEALAELRCEKELKIVPARSKRSRFAADWFGRHLYSHSVATD
jgi:putative phosphoribosyl transferase